MKKIISLLIPLCVAFAMMTAVSFAADTDEQEPAEGTEVQVLMEDQAVDLTEGEDQTDPSQTQEEDPPAPPDDEVFTPGWRQDPDGWRYYTTQDTYEKGVKMIGGSSYFFDYTTGLMKTGWVTDNHGYKYYCNKNGDAPGVAGSSLGTMLSGFQTIDKKKYYFQPKNYRMKTGWLTEGKNKYYFSKSGVMKTGWLKLNGNKYYFASSGKMVTGKKSIKGETYFFNESSGKMITGFHTISGKKYYFSDPSGKMKKDSWVTVSGSKYHLNAKGIVETGYKKIGSEHYFFNSSGQMRKGAIKYSGALYYFFSSGKAVKRTGWFKGSDGKSRYCYNSAGKVYTGEKKIGSYYYVFDSKSGICVKNLGDATDRSIQKQSGGNGYLLLVQKSNYTVRVYRGSKNNWNRIYTFKCAVGTSKKPTDTGTFYVKGKTDHHNYSGKHWNNGLDLTAKGPKGNGFNGYVWSGEYPDGDIIDDKLGGRYTGGRIRVSESNSVWLYNNVPVGAKVIIK